MIVSPQNLAAQQLASGAVEEKPRFNIYTMMLIVSLIAIIAACALLWYELKSFGPFPQWKTSNELLAHIDKYFIQAHNVHKDDLDHDLLDAIRMAARRIGEHRSSIVQKQNPKKEKKHV